MQFTSFALSALSIGSAIATATATEGVTVHVVKVGSTNGSLSYSPNNLVAAIGDMVQFQFAPANHTVTQSTFDAPCQPIASHSNVTGVFSGFMAVKATAVDAPTYTIKIKNKTPMWLYCSQGKHCQAGMTMVINENTAANATRSLANFQALAKGATANLAPGATAAGNSTSGSGTAGSTSGSSPSSTPASGGAGSSGSSTSSGDASTPADAGASSASSSASAAPTTQVTSFASRIQVPMYAGLFAAALAFLV